MRDIIFTIVVAGMLPSCFRRPFIGLLVFSWLAYMRAQDLTWGFARTFRWSYTVAIVTFAGFLMGPRQRLFARDLRCYVLLLLVAIIGIGVALSKNPDPYQIKRFMEFTKIVGVALFTTAVVKNREHLRILIWIIALSFAFYGVKSGIWGILTGGQTAINQGPGGMLADNNDFSLALAMGVPFLVMVGLSEKRQILRRTFLYSVPLTVITIGLTHSRGGFLALAAGTLVLIWRSRNRLAGLSIVTLAALAAFLVAPQSYKERIYSIGSYEEDGSAQARLRSWAVGARMATDNPLFGVGLSKFRQHYMEYEPNPTATQRSGKGVYVAHNSYIQIWAEVGTLAFALFLILIAMTFWSCWRVRRLAKQRYFASWIANYATMFEASLVTFLIGSVFLNRAHFDLFYHFVAIVLVFDYIAMQEMKSEVDYPVRVDGQRGPLRIKRRAGFGRSGARRSFRKTPLLES